MEARFEFRLDPVKEAEKLKKGMRTKALRIAMNKAAAVVKAAVISHAPQQTGALAKSIRIKVKNYKNADTWVAVIGPGSKFTRGRGKKKRRPANYATLVERGTRKMRARPFLKPALQQTRQRYVETLQQTIREQVAQLLSSAA